jgi:hypothetical protein
MIKLRQKIRDSAAFRLTKSLNGQRGILDTLKRTPSFRGTLFYGISY